jgi:hypothetical protein
MNFLNAAYRSTYFHRQMTMHFKHPFFKKKKYLDHPILKDGAANDYLRELLLRKEPCFVTRIGGTECEVMRQTELIRHHMKRHYTPEIIKNAQTLSGIYPNTPEYLGAFTDLYLDGLKEATAFGVWFRPMEDYFIGQYSHYESILDFYALYPGVNSWTTALKGQKVLIVSPFSKTVQSQYQKRALIFPKNPELLPEFTLLTYQSVVSFAGQKASFPTWGDALNFMFEEIKKMDFDVCLLGCGAYGLPLGAMIYRQLGKKVIHVGGSLQLLFGIDGALYHDYDRTKHLMNENWVYPSDEETPVGANQVEGSMYWKK